MQACCEQTNKFYARSFSFSAFLQLYSLPFGGLQSSSNAAAYRNNRKLMPIAILQTYMLFGTQVMKNNTRCMLR
jgi:hypothetical protein